MLYALMIYAEPGLDERIPQEEREGVTAEYQALLDDPRVVQAARLHPAEAATCVRVVDGRTLVSDGPFADTKEILGGLALFEADDLDEALEMAARIPAARMGGAVEVRPVVVQP
ncbi:MAG: hypothetical protein J2P22_11750 [Nocardioides sp.]|nr:hypothetical protein [Nocardioides sp.]